MSRSKRNTQEKRKFKIVKGRHLYVNCTPMIEHESLGGAVHGGLPFLYILVLLQGVEDVALNTTINQQADMGHPENANIVRPVQRG
ncbi:hypothetical protein gpAD87_31260 [Paenibacillus sp. AD87]|nr:hypothetical protein gpAD87_31260 [Paenibacillus sp. AD87]